MPDRIVFKTYPLNGAIEPVIRQILSDYRISDRPTALEKVCPGSWQRQKTPGSGTTDTRPARIEMIRHIFYRGQGAYLIGRMVAAGEQIIPLAMALLNSSAGVVVDALLLDADGVSIVFLLYPFGLSRAGGKPGELVGFLKSIMPAKPEAEIYSAIGYFKHGKTVLYQDVCRHTAECTDDRFRYHRASGAWSWWCLTWPTTKWWSS
jgi:isocitrate dehydrogenase kinase/phosphatase